MNQRPSVVIHFGEVEHDEPLRESIEKHCERLAADFEEINKIEVSLTANGAGFETHAHVTGKGIDIATQAAASELAPSADLVFKKTERQLRTIHDKRIFAQRREARRDPAKRQEVE